jgi:hypothetical protein
VRAAALRGDWAAVDAMLVEAKNELGQHEWVASVLRSMQEIANTRARMAMSKEALYSSSKLGRRLAAKDEAGPISMSIEVPAYLRRKPRQGKDGR